MKNFATTFLATLLAAGLALIAYEKYREHQQQQQIAEAEQSRQGYINAAYLAQGLGALSQLKPHIEIYWHERGKLPCPADDLHLPTELIARQTPSVSEVALSDCGALTATHTEASGLAGGRLTLRASEIVTATDRGLAWECTTPDYPEIEMHMPGCRYRPQAEDEAPVAAAAQQPAAAEVSMHDPVTAAATEDCRNGVVLHRSVFTDSVVDRTAGKRFVALGPDSKS